MLDAMQPLRELYRCISGNRITKNTTVSSLYCRFIPSNSHPTSQEDRFSTEIRYLSYLLSLMCKRDTPTEVVHSDIRRSLLCCIPYNSVVCALEVAFVSPTSTPDDTEAFILVLNTNVPGKLHRGLLFSLNNKFPTTISEELLLINHCRRLQSGSPLFSPAFEALH